MWRRADADTELSSPWIGSTQLMILRPHPPEDYKWVSGRLIVIQTTNRPDNIWPNIWQPMSKTLRETAIKEWNLEKRKREEARTRRGILFAPLEEVEVFNKTNTEAKAKYTLPDAPALPVIPNTICCLAEDIDITGPWSVLSQPAVMPRAHQEHEAPSGYVSNDWLVLVHTPVPMSKVIKIPKAKMAVQGEWDKQSGCLVS